jgi:hypothetical protein
MVIVAGSKNLTAPEFCSFTIASFAVEVVHAYACIPARAAKQGTRNCIGRTSKLISFRL